MASDLIKITGNYVTVANDLTGSGYSVIGQSLYLRKADLLITNNATGAAIIGSDGTGIIAELQHAPSISTSGSPMALRLKNVDSALAARIKTLLGATELV